jgi:hypothetical protein
MFDLETLKTMVSGTSKDIFSKFLVIIIFQKNRSLYLKILGKIDVHIKVGEIIWKGTELLC